MAESGSEPEGASRPAAGGASRLAAAVALVTALVFLPALSNDFVNWDDPVDLLENPYARSLDAESIRRAFTEIHVNGNWIPLTWISHAAVSELFGLDPRAHHLVNVVWHAVNAGLVFLLFLKMLGLAAGEEEARRQARRHAIVAALGALFWSLHPLRVESVAWVTELKDVGSTFFLLLAALAYLRVAATRDRRPGRARLLPCLVFFVLSLLYKPMAVTLPVVLLVLDAWPLRRLGPGPGRARVLIEKAPFFIIAIASGIIAIIAQGGAVVSVDKLPAAFRVMNAFHSIVFYMLKTAVPVDLAPLYPIANPHAAFTTRHVIAAALVVAVTALCALRAARGRLAVPAAWFIYLVALAPVLGLLQVGVQAAADRYTYVPALSLSLLVAAAVGRLQTFAGARAAAARRTRPAFVVFAAGIVVLALLCRNQIFVWRSSISLWEHQVSVHPGESSLAYANLGRAYRDARRTDDALQAYRTATAIGAPHARTHDGLGCVLLDKGLVDEAIAEVRMAAAKDPAYAEPWRNLWTALSRKGDEAGALAAIRKAVEISPGFGEAYWHLAASLFQQGEAPAAQAAAGRALALAPESLGYAAHLGTAVMRQGRLGEAEFLFRAVLDHDPAQRQALLNLGLTLNKQGRFHEAIPHLAAAGRLDPTDAPAFQLLGEACMQSERLTEAAAAFNDALRADSRFGHAHLGLAQVYLAQGNLEQARRHLQAAEALGLSPPPKLRSRIMGG